MWWKKKGCIPENQAPELGCPKETDQAGCKGSPKSRLGGPPCYCHHSRQGWAVSNSKSPSLSPFLPQISPEEEERRRVRRERNKLAAAKCRNRRKELTDFLQAVSKAGLRVPSLRPPATGGTHLGPQVPTPPPAPGGKDHPLETDPGGGNLQASGLKLGFPRSRDDELPRMPQASWESWFSSPKHSWDL